MNEQERALIAYRMERAHETITEAMTTCRDVVSGESLPIDRQNVYLTLKPFAIRWVDVA